MTKAKNIQKMRRTGSVVKRTGALFLTIMLAVLSIPLEHLQAGTLAEEIISAEESIVSEIPMVDGDETIYTTGDGSFQFAYIRPAGISEKVAVILGYQSRYLEGGELIIPDTVDAYCKYSDETGVNVGYVAVGKSGHYLFYKVEVCKLDESGNVVTEWKEMLDPANGLPLVDENGSALMEEVIVYETVYKPCFYADYNNWSSVEPSELYYDENAGVGEPSYKKTKSDEYQRIRNVEVAYIGNQYLMVDDSTGAWKIAGEITESSQGVFACKGNLVSLTIGENLIGIGNYAFYGCAGLSTVQIGNGLETIEDYVFANCVNLKTVSIDVNSGLKSIGNSAFYNCQALKGFTMPIMVSVIGDSVFENCYAMTDIDLCGKDLGLLTKIGKNVFKGCECLSSITFPKGFHNQEEGVDVSMFEGCTSLEYISASNEKFDLVEGDNESFGFEEFKAQIQEEFYVEGITDSPLHQTCVEQGILFKVTDNVYYKVSFYDYDGTLLDAQSVLVGEDALPPTNPKREGYVFSGWMPDYHNVTSDMSILALYEEEKIISSYTVSFYDYDGTLLNTQSVLAGEDALPPTNPKREGYVFSGWVPDYHDVNSDLAIIAQYEEEKEAYYTVNFYDYDDTLLKSQSVLAGEDAEPPMEPIREGYIFTGWRPNFENVTSDLSIYAQYEKEEEKQYLVTFYDADGTILYTQKVKEGENASIPMSPSKEGYVFSGWLPNIEGVEISENTNVYATYEAVVSKEGTILPYEGAKYELSYEIDDIGIVITGCTKYAAIEDLGKLVIPEKIDDMLVYKIADNAFKGCVGFTGDLVLPVGVESIGKSAFYKCAGFNGTLTLPSGLKSIGNYAFYGCGGFSGNLTLPEGLEGIGESAFNNCSGFNGGLILPDGIKTIGNCAFRDCVGFTGDLLIPASVEEIGDYAFYKCTGFDGTLTLSSGLESIGKYAFFQCNGLGGDLVIPSTVTSIGAYSFIWCPNFTEIIISEGVAKIEKGVFAHYNGIITISKSVSEIVEGAITNSTTIFGYRDTETEKYAKENEIAFIYLDEEREIEEYEVSNSEELLEAIGSYRHILLKDGLYEFDDTLELNGKAYLTIEAENAGAVEFIVNNVDVPVVSIQGAYDVKVNGCILGHISSQHNYGCGLNGYVVYVINSDNVRISECDLYGCGIEGVRCISSSNLLVENCVIRDCMNMAVYEAYSENISLKNCIISGNNYVYTNQDTIVDSDEYSIGFENCKFLNNYGAKLIDNQKSSIINCVYSDNAWQEVTPRVYGVCLNGITWQVENDVLKIGYPIKLQDNTVIESTSGAVLNYSASALPWKKYLDKKVEVAEGIIYEDSSNSQSSIGDVDKDSWEYVPSLYVYEKGIMTGKGFDEKGNVIFAPKENLTREQFAQVLYSAEGKEKVTYTDRFLDVMEGKWYTDAVLWAAEKGIVSGYENGEFGVEDNITREQLAAMLYKYAEYKGYDTDNLAEVEDFEDVQQISSWAVSRLQWAVGNGIMSGKGTKLDPIGNATRAECATMLRKFFISFDEAEGAFREVESKIIYEGAEGLDFKGFDPDHSAYYIYRYENNLLVKITDYNYEGESGWWWELKYDALGNLVKETAYNEDGRIIVVYSYGYDDVRNRVKRSCIDEDGRIYSWYVYEYDRHGNRIKETTYNEDGSIYNWREYGYDSIGNCIQEKYFNSTGTVYSWYKFEYDAAGKCIKKITCNVDGSVSYEVEYDANGNLMKSTSYNSDCTVSSWNTYEYDENGRETKCTDYNGDGSIEQWTEYEYSKEGKNWKTTYYKGDGSIRYWVENEYDDSGRRIKYTYYKNDGSIYEWTEYEYDEDGSKIKDIKYTGDGILVSIFEYYPGGIKWKKETIFNPDGSIKSETIF